MADPAEKSDLEARIEALERTVATLQSGVARSAPQSAPTPPRMDAAARPPAPRAEIPWAKPARTLDLETLVGRYGMLGAAVLLALVAVGTFVGWAIRHGLLGPEVRVVLGLLAAAAFAAFGLVLGIAGKHPLVEHLGR